MTISLSPMDYYFYRRHLYTIQFVFEYHGHMDRKKMEVLLNTTARYIPAISSRLVIKSDTEIVLQTGYPIEINHRTLTDEPETHTAISVNALLSSVCNQEQEPLFKVLVTQTPSRTFIGFSFSHMLGDGTSFFQFMRIFCDLARNKEPHTCPLNTRELVKAKTPLTHDFENDLFKNTGYCIPRPPTPKSVSTEFSFFSIEEIKRLRGPHKITTNDIIMASLAKKYHTTILLHNGKFIVRCPVDYRKIYNLPTYYFGNAVRDAITEFHPEEIHKLGLIDIALRIRSSIQSINEQSVSNSLRSLEDLRQRYGIKIFEEIGCPGLLVSNFSHFPINEMDFGLGAPLGFHHASLNPRLALILAKEGGFESRFKKPLE